MPLRDYCRRSVKTAVNPRSSEPLLGRSYQLKGVPEEVILYRIVRATGGGHPRPNYYRLIARTVKGLDRRSAQTRNAVYERARKALVAQLRFNQPTLSKVDIAKERFVLEEAGSRSGTRDANGSADEAAVGDTTGHAR